MIQNINAKVKTCYLDIEVGWFCSESTNKIFLERMYDLYSYALEKARDTELQVLPFDRMQLVINKINNNL